uniref:Protein kinase domain-containing protein n=4 Tax=Brassica TaxID=3705 RepID=A0A0D3DVS1_BRAOL|nr:unnamed protein product [Brassica oleracea]
MSQAHTQAVVGMSQAHTQAVVGDFGLAKLLNHVDSHVLLNHVDSHVTTAVRGTVGHIASEYLSTGQSFEKLLDLGLVYTC